jgi:uncharacterized membrane protein
VTTDGQPTRPRSLAAASGACFGAGAGGLLAANLRVEAAPLLTAGALLGAALAARRPAAPALAHPWLAALAALAGLLMTATPEPAFFLLVPLVVAAVAWPFALPDAPPPPLRRALPGWALPAAFAVGAAVFFVQSAGRYWAYGAGSKDLGLFYQTHWLIAHGLPPLNTVMGMHALADHMELLDYVVAPLIRIHDGPETLLLVQALAVASAVFPLGWMGARILESSRAGLALACAWLLAPDVHAGVMFDYNPMLLGAAFLLWTAWALLCRGWIASLVTASVASLAREDMCLYVAALAAVLTFRSVPRRRALAVAAVALAIFAVEVGVLFPRFRSSGFRHWEQFAEAGETAAAAPAGPAAFASALVDHPQKRRSLLQPLAATGFVGLADPIAVVLQVPNWAERFYSSYGTRWWGYHYGAPAAATALVGVILGWRRLRGAGREGPRMGAYVAGCALVIGLLPPYSTPALREHRVRRSELYLARVPYAMAPEDVATADAAAAFVGRNPYLVVAAQDRLLPRLAGRRTILMLDRAHEAEVVVLQTNGATWPDGRPTWRRRMRELWATGAFGVAFCEGRTVVLRRGAASIACPAWDEVVRPAPDQRAGGSPGPASATSQPAAASTVAPAPAAQATPAAGEGGASASTPGARDR